MQVEVTVKNRVLKFLAKIFGLVASESLTLQALNESILKRVMKYIMELDKEKKWKDF